MPDDLLLHPVGLHQHLFWRVDKLKTDAELLPHESEELWIHIPDDKLYLVER